MACDYDYPQRRNKRKNKRKEKKKHPYKKGGIQRTSKFLGTK
ncbi:MAG: hypothetical protein NTU63_02845 [Candidatus Pacearchaeota archaeon]|nr:hypothetical protein [Candidatus Pacearchaeota archaeon]